MTEVQEVTLPPQEERLLVTFALFAYNQEKYIREAIEGAFAQKYEPLEIILSDDCSTDQTFEIMKEMASLYDGPHKIKVRRNAFNMGTALHVYSAFLDSRGALFVVAAGDDISLSIRTSEIVSAWNKAGRPPGVIHSGRETFIDTLPGKTQLYPANTLGDGRDVLRVIALPCWLPAAAPTCAYTREVFELFPPLFGGSIIEDAPLLLRSALVGNYIKCELPLIRQRVHIESNGSGYRITEPKRWNRFIQSKLIAFRNMQSDLNNWHGNSDPKLLAEIEKNIMRVLVATSQLFVPEGRPLRWTERLKLTLLMLKSQAISDRLRARCGHILTFFGFESTRKLLVKILKFYF